MRRCRPAPLAAALLAALTAACATGPGVVEKPVGAADVPLVFAYGGLDPAGGKYRRIGDSRGTVAYELVLTAPQAMALFGYYTVAGDDDLAPGDLRFEAESAFGAGRPSWGEDGTVRAGVDATDYQLFEVAGRGLHCIALRRSFRDHVEAPAGSVSQAQARGFYCRTAPPLTTAEAPAVAAALRLR